MQVKRIFAWIDNESNWLKANIETDAINKVTAKEIPQYFQPAGKPVEMAGKPRKRIGNIDSRTNYSIKLVLENGVYLGIERQQIRIIRNIVGN